MTILRPPATPTSQLSYDAAGNRYTGEISSTHGLGPVYDDACDEGMTLVGKSGREIVFVVDRTERDADGDVTCWTLRPANATEWAGGTVLLFND